MITHTKTNVLYVTGACLIGLFLFFIRIYGLDLAPLSDYDAVKNYILAKQISNLDF